MKRLIVVTDLGHLKAYAIHRNGYQPVPSIELIREDTFSEYHPRMTDRVSDLAGRFPGGGQTKSHAGIGQSQGGMSRGEEHHAMEEVRRLQLNRVADTVESVVNGDSWASVYLAAPKTIHRALCDLLPREIRDRLQKELCVDLVKVPKAELLKRFGLVQPAPSPAGRGNMLTRGRGSWRPSGNA